MGDFHKKPGSPGDILEHHGVKGQKWGVRKKDEPAGNGPRASKDLADHNAKTKEYMAAAQKISKPKTAEEAIANLRANQDKFAKKFEPSDGTTKNAEDSAHEPRLTPQQKKALLYAGGAAAVIGGVYLANKYYIKPNVDLYKELTSLPGFTKPPDAHALGLKSMDEVHTLAGKRIDPTTFHGLVGYSQGKSWMGDSYLNDAAFARPEFELPKDHTFFRLATKAESKFSMAGGTFCTADTDDFNRYIAGFRQEKGMSAAFHKISWKSTEPIRVPNLTTILGQLHGVLEEEAKSPTSSYHGTKIDSNAVLKAYQDLSGTAMSSVRGQSLIERLQRQGYGAVIDEMDAGVIGNRPLLLFNGGKNVTGKVSEPLTNSAIKAAEAALKEIEIPPGRKI